MCQYHKLQDHKTGTIQGSAKEWSLGCVQRALAARGGQDAGITQPRDNYLADPYMIHVHEVVLKAKMQQSR